MVDDKCRELHKDLEEHAYKMIKTCVGKLEDRYETLREIIAIRFTGQADALSIATKSLEKKFVEVNNLRAEVLEDRQQYLQKNEYVIQHQAIVRELNEIEKKLNDFMEKTNITLSPLAHEYKVRVTLIGWVAIGSFLVSAVSGIFHWWRMP